MTAGGVAEEITLMEWVKLKVSDPSHLWTAKTVQAIVSPKLCLLILLGLPFLICNNIVIDHTAWTVVDKMSKFDLMNPTGPPTGPRPKLKLRKMFKKVQKDRAEVIQELKAKSMEQKELVDATSETVRKLDLIAVVRQKMEILAVQEKLMALGNQIKKEFHSVFEPIPHVNRLPDEVLCEIKLKDASQTIATWSYSSPRCYKDAWSTLIQQHLDAGHIRPSNSANASPAFLIPKADRAELP
jgi:hypothetical protein